MQGCIKETVSMLNAFPKIEEVVSARRVQWRAEYYLVVGKHISSERCGDHRAQALSSSSS